MHKSIKLIIPLFALAFLLVSCNKQPTEAPVVPLEPVEQEAFKSLPTQADGSVAADAQQSAIAKARAALPATPLTGKHRATIMTQRGDIVLELDADAAPKTVTNFITLAKAGYYDGTIVHRVIPDFMIQMGDPNGNGTGGESVYGPTFEDEINARSYGLEKITVREAAEGQEVPPEIADLTVEDYLTKYEGYTFNTKLKSLSMERGAIAMANRGANTNGSQFFIVQRQDGTPWLNGKHTVFGKVVEGMDIVDLLATLDRNAQDLPNQIISIKIVAE